MKDVASKGGRTVLFVSHNLAAIRQLCSSGLLLENGALAIAGPTNKVADAYLKSTLNQRRRELQLSETGYTTIRLVDSAGVPISAVLPETQAFIELGIRVVSGADIQAGITIFNQKGVPLVLCASEYGGITGLQRGEYRFLVKVPNEFLPPGIYRIEGAVWNAHQVFYQDDYLGYFHVIPTSAQDLHGRTSSAQYMSRDPWIALSAESVASLEAIPTKIRLS